MNIYTSLFLYVLVLLNNNLVDSLKLQFKFNGSKKINDKNKYCLLKVNENEGHYFFFALVRCTKVVADGTVLWKFKEGDMCPRAVSYFGTDEVAVNFPEDMMVFKKVNGEWVKTPGTKENVQGSPDAACIESDHRAKDKGNHPAAEEVELPVKLTKEPNYDLPWDNKVELTTDCYKQKTKPSEEQAPKPAQPEPVQPVVENTEDSSSPPAAPENEST